MTAISRRALLGFVAAPAVWAADFWEKQPNYLAWSPAEVNKMLRASPWARTTLIRARGGGRGFSGRSDGGFNGTRGGGRTPSAGSATSPSGIGNRSSDFSLPAGTGSLELLVRWYSAKPIKHAVVASRLQTEGARFDDEAKGFIDRDEPHYVLTVTGIPEAQGRRFVEYQHRLAIASRLERKGKAAILPETTEARDRGEVVDLYFYFPQTDPIVEADKRVDFVFDSALGADKVDRGELDQEIRTRFDLKAMVYQGVLAL